MDYPHYKGENQFTLNAWLWKCGLEEVPHEQPINHIPSLESLATSEWSPTFEKYMRNRLILGAFRYGLLNSPGKETWDRVSSIIKRAELYQQTGNTEYLVDIANMAMLEYEEGKHPTKHFAAIDNTNVHVTKIK